MKPNLVEVIIPSPKPKIIKKIHIISPINYTSLLFNLICILFIIVGIYVLYIRKENKEINKKKYIKNVNNLYKKIYNKI